MMEPISSLSIEHALIPVYYRQFHCLAARCRDSCCLNWKIEFDKKDFLSLKRRKAPPDVASRLAQGVRRLRGNAVHDGYYGAFQLEHGRCPLLDPEGLCALQRACGPEALPRVCRIFPRHITYTPAAKEYSLSLGCEGVLKLLYAMPEGVEFIEEPLPPGEHRHLSLPGGELSFAFPEVRSLCVDLLQDRTYSMSGRMLLLGLALQDLRLLDWSAPDLAGWSARTRALFRNREAGAQVGALPGNLAMFLTNNIRVLFSLYAGDGRALAAELFSSLSIDPEQALGSLRAQFERADYQESLERFQRAFGSMEPFFENLMVAAAFHTKFPALSSREALWQSYVGLCCLYSFFRFAAVSGCRDEATPERLFHVLATASRCLLHNSARQAHLRGELFQNDSATLAHMAILVGG